MAQWEEIGKTRVIYTESSGLSPWEGVITGELTSESIPNISEAKTVEIGNSVTDIGPEAFRYCENLTNVIIPNSVVDIGGAAFHNTPFYNNQPDDIMIFGRVVYKMKGTCPEVMTIPNGITSIGCMAF